MRKVLLLTLGILCAFHAMAQNTDAMLFGDVKSKETGEHLPGAIIRVKGTTLVTQCDKSGHFKLPDLPVGKQTIVASLVGYKSQEVVVAMARNKGTEAYFQLEEDAFDLSQVVVTGTRTAHFIKDVPVRTEVITSQAMTKKNAQSLFDALEGIPGIRAEQQCQSCNFSMVRMQGLGAEHTQILVDGAPVYSGLAGVYGLQQIGTNDVDRLEIVKGAGSALYGSSAVAGAINIVSKEPSFEPSVNADVQFGNWGYKNYNASGSMRNSKMGLNVFLQRTEMDAVDETQDGMTRSEVKHKDGVSDRVSEQLTNLGFNLYFFNPFATGDKLILRGKALDEQRYGGTMTGDLYLNPFSEGTENIKTNRLSADLQYKLPVGARSEFNLSAAYVYHRRNATNDTFLSSYKDSHRTDPDDPETGQSPDVELMRPYMAKENSFAPSLTFTSTLASHRLLAGVQGYFTKLRETGMYCIDDSESAYYGTAYTSVGKKHADEYGFFVQDEWDVTPRLTVVPGVRLDIHDSGEEYTSSEKVFDGTFPKTSFSKTTVNPRLAVKYDVSPALVLRANFGTGFRAPYGFSEDLHLCSGSPRVWKSSGLKGERSVSYNLSADYYGSNYQFSVNVFRTDLKDKIQFETASQEVKKLGYTYQWVNVDDAYVQGVELSAKGNLLKDLAAGLSWTFNQGKFKHERADWADPSTEENTAHPSRLQYAKDSRYISRFPSMTGDLSLDYTPGTWTFSVTGSFQGSMYIDYNSEDNGANSKIKKTSPFMLFNCRVAKRMGNMITLYAGGKNIFSYIQDEKHTDDAAFMYAPVYGATWYAGVSVKL